MTSMTFNIIKAYCCLMMMGILWGAMTPFAKDAINHGLSQLVISGFRMWGACLLFFIWSSFKPKIEVLFNDKLKMAVAGLLAISLDQGLYIWGISLTSPLDGSVISAMTPIFVLLLSLIFLGKKVGLVKTMGLLIGLVGALIIVLSAGSIDKHGTILGDLIIIIAILCFSAYVAFFTDFAKRYRIDVMMKWMFFFAALFFTPFMLEDALNYRPFDYSLRVNFDLFFCVFGGTFLTYLCLYEGQKYLSSEVVAVFNYIQPVVGGLLAVYMGMSEFGWQKALGSILVFISVWLVIKRRKNVSNS